MQWSKYVFYTCSDMIWTFLSSISDQQCDHCVELISTFGKHLWYFLMNLQKWLHQDTSCWECNNINCNWFVDNWTILIHKWIFLICSNSSTQFDFNIYRHCTIILTVLYAPHGVEHGCLDYRLASIFFKSRSIQINGIQVQSSTQDMQTIPMYQLNNVIWVWSIFYIFLTYMLLSFIFHEFWIT